tara:strand:+ start:543 stop:752 length:210 start_codon:yes stop_codon:yes gene_type:complete
MEKLITIKLTKAEVLAVKECCHDAESEVRNCAEEECYDAPNISELFSSAMTKIVYSIRKGEKYGNLENR